MIVASYNNSTTPICHSSRSCFKTEFSKLSTLTNLTQTYRKITSYLYLNMCRLEYNNGIVHNWCMCLVKLVR